MKDFLKEIRKKIESARASKLSIIQAHSEGFYMSRKQTFIEDFFKENFGKKLNPPRHPNFQLSIIHYQLTFTGHPYSERFPNLPPFPFPSLNESVNPVK